MKKLLFIVPAFIAFISGYSQPPIVKDTNIVILETIKPGQVIRMDDTTFNKITSVIYIDKDFKVEGFTCAYKIGIDFHEIQNLKKMKAYVKEHILKNKVEKVYIDSITIVGTGKTLRASFIIELRYTQ